RRFAPRLQRLLRRDVVRAEDAHDLVQQTFLQLHRARHEFRTGAKLRPWLFTIALNLKRQYYRTSTARSRTRCTCSPVTPPSCSRRCCSASSSAATPRTGGAFRL